MTNLPDLAPASRVLTLEENHSALRGRIDLLGMEVFADVVSALSRAEEGDIAQLTVGRGKYGVNLIRPSGSGTTYALTFAFAGAVTAALARVTNAVSGVIHHDGPVVADQVIPNIPAGSVVTVLLGDAPGYLTPVIPNLLMDGDRRVTVQYDPVVAPAAVVYDAEGYFLILNTQQTVGEDGLVLYPDIPQSIDADGYAVWEV